MIEALIEHMSYREAKQETKNFLSEADLRVYLSAKPHRVLLYWLVLC